MKKGCKNLGIMVLGAMFMIVILSMLSGCVTQKRCNGKFPPVIETITNHTKEIIRKDSLLPGSVVTNTFYKDSIITMEVNKWYSIKDTTGQTELRFYKDAYGNLHGQCITNSQLIEKLEERINTSVNTTKTPAPRIVKETPIWAWLLIIILAITVTLLKFKKFLL